MRALLEAIKSFLAWLPKEKTGGALAGLSVAPKAPTGVRDVGLIKESEGLRLTAYLPTPNDVWTIGYGHTKTARKGMRITKEGAEALLLHDLEWVETAISVYVDVPLTQNQYDALASFIYNVGATAFRKSTLLRMLNAGDYAGAANQFGSWNKQKGKVLNGLTTRRQKEKMLFLL